MDSILYERISGLCKARGITITKMATDLGIGTSLIRKWKQTSSPSIDKVKLIAEYFDVSTDYLIGLSNFHPHLHNPENDFLPKLLHQV